MINKIKSKWNEIIKYTVDTYGIGKSSYTTFLLPLYPYYYEKRNEKKDLLHITIDKENNDYDANFDFKNFVKYINKKYSNQLSMSINNFFYNIDIVIEDNIINFTEYNDKDYLLEKERLEKSHLDLRYTFDNFIYGPSNNLAYSAANYVAKKPGQGNNPLFIYGNSGLGKTHLLHSIGNYVFKHFPEKKIIYISAENFTNELIESFKTKTTSIFRNKYRNTDLLLLDDIQFISGKDSIQDEVFATFNDMYLKRKCIVFTSDQPPKNIPSIDERLRTRLGSGGTYDIQKPDYATRMAILRQKYEEFCILYELKPNITLNDDILKYIAANCTDNVRSLEACLQKVLLLTNLNGPEISLDMAKNVLIDLITEKENKKIDVEYIIKIVSEHFNVKVEDIIGKRRTNNIVIPRHVAMYLSKEFTDLSLKNIGDNFGKRDHSTVINAIDNINKELSTNNELSDHIKIIIKKISPQKN